MTMPRLGLSTPQPYRAADDLLSTYETEHWDDNANAVFYNQVDPVFTYTVASTQTGATNPTHLCYLEVPCPVPARLEIGYSAQITTGLGKLNVQFGIVASIPLPDPGDPHLTQDVKLNDQFHITGLRVVDFPAGLAIIANYIVIPAAFANVTLYTNNLVIRRGRKP